jgi:uroporphyrinogen III methyltransferase/synthase
VAEGLLEALSSVELEGKKVLIPRAQEAREVLPETLRSRGAEVVVAPVYKTIHPALPEGLSNWPKEATRVLFTSSSTVTNWLALTDRREIPCFCIGPITAGTAEKAGLKVLGTAEVHTIEGLVHCVRELDGRSKDLL